MICTLPQCVEHFACQLRNKGVQVSPKATPSRVRNRTQPVRPMAEPSWEKGIVGERRIDGSFMPVLVPGSDRPMGVHEQAGQRSTVETGLRRLKSDPHVFTKAG